VMFILARGGKSYARLRFNVGPRTSQLMNVEVDYSQPFEASNNFEWKREFDANVQEIKWRKSSLLADAAYADLDRNPFPFVEEQPLGHFDDGLEQNDEEEDWFSRLEADPQFLDWEDTECEIPLPAIPA